MSIENAVARFRRNVGNLEAFREAGLTPDDFKALGLEDLLETEGRGSRSPARSSAPGRSVRRRVRRAGFVGVVERGGLLLRPAAREEAKASSKAAAPQAEA